MVTQESDVLLVAKENIMSPKNMVICLKLSHCAQMRTVGHLTDI